MKNNKAPKSKHNFLELEMEYQELYNGLRAGGMTVSKMHEIIHRMEEIEAIMIAYGLWGEDEWDWF